MEVNAPVVFIHGMEKIIEKDLNKHKALLERSKLELLAFRNAVAHEIKKKKHYKSLIGGGKYNDKALRESMNMIAIGIRHMSDKVKLSQEAVAHHTLIVDTLAKQLADHYHGLEHLARYKREKLNAANN